MPVRIFQSSEPNPALKLEGEINAWLEELPVGSEVKHLQPVFGTPMTGGTIFAIIVYYTEGEQYRATP
jgi:hypothetical protein